MPKLRGTISGTVEVDVRDGFSVDVALVTRLASGDLAPALVKRKWDPRANNGRGGIVQEQDYARFQSERLRRMIPTARGLTPEILLSLVDLDEAVELDVPELVDGCVPWSHDHVCLTQAITLPAPTASNANAVETSTTAYTVPTLLYAFSTEFSSLIDSVQEQWKGLRAEAEKKSGMTSSASAE